MSTHEHTWGEGNQLAGAEDYLMDEVFLDCSPSNF